MPINLVHKSINCCQVNKYMVSARKLHCPALHFVFLLRSSW